MFNQWRQNLFELQLDFVRRETGGTRWAFSAEAQPIVAMSAWAGSLDILSEVERNRAANIDGLRWIER